MLRIDDITAVYRLFQGIFRAEAQGKNAHVLWKYPTTQIGNNEAIILLVVDIRSTFERVAQATYFLKKMSLDKELPKKIRSPTHKKAKVNPWLFA